MNKKTIGAVLLAIAATLGGPVAVDHVQQVNDERREPVTLTGPAEAAVGELCILAVTGSRASWRLPETDSYKIDANSVVLSFREPGEYTVFASAIGGRSTAIVAHTILVLAPVVPEVTPVIVVDIVPEPTPDPVPDTPVVASLVDEVYGWCVDSTAPTATIEKLAKNFTDASHGESIEEILTHVARANRKVNQTGCEEVLARVQQYLFDNLNGKGVVAHQEAFAQIGEGLSTYTR
jgi:hypothetical protein